MKDKITVLLAGALCLTGCASTTIRVKGTSKLSDPPAYQSSEPFYFWGTVGTARIDAKQVCEKENKRVAQMQSQRTFFDGVLSLLTVGIYFPLSAKVWCEEGEKAI